MNECNVALSPLKEADIATISTVRKPQIMVNTRSGSALQWS